MKLTKMDYLAFGSNAIRMLEIGGYGGHSYYGHGQSHGHGHGHGYQQGYYGLAPYFGGYAAHGLAGAGLGLGHGHGHGALALGGGYHGLLGGHY